MYYVDHQKYERCVFLISFTPLLIFALIASYLEINTGKLEEIKEVKILSKIYEKPYTYTRRVWLGKFFVNRDETEPEKFLVSLKCDEMSKTLDDKGLYESVVSSQSYIMCVTFDTWDNEKYQIRNVQFIEEMKH